MKIPTTLKSLIPAMVCALGVIMVADAALAQPKAMRRPSRSSRGRTPPPKKAPPVAPKVDVAMCGSRQAVMENEQRRLDDRKANLAGIEAEIEQLTRRLDDLQRRRAQLSGQVAASKVHLEYKRATYGNECREAVNCGQYENFVSEMERQNKPAEQAMNRIRDEISQSRKDVSGLRRRIEPLRREYQSKSCNRLQPGRTSQSTIDRCTSIFSEWNRLQSDLNHHNNRLPILRSRYQQLAAQLKSTEQRAKGYEEYLSRNCKKSPKLGVVRRYRSVHSRASKLNDELNRLIDDVKSLRNIRITVD